LSGLAATLREAEPGTRVSLVLEDGEEIAGALGEVSGETVDLDDEGRQIDLAQVKRLRLDFSSTPTE
jgi:hypothetical protein